jgi:hypothetical protein
MDCVVRQGVNRRSIPAVLIVALSKINALSNQSFLAMASGRVEIIPSRSFRPSNVKCWQEMAAANPGIPLNAMAMVSRS